MNYVFKSPDHPEAVGNTAKEGDEEYVFLHPTDEGGEVRIKVGRPGLVAFTAIILDFINDDPALLEEAWAKFQEQIK